MELSCHETSSLIQICIPPNNDTIKINVNGMFVSLIYFFRVLYSFYNLSALKSLSYTIKRKLTNIQTLPFLTY
jgi:hypothetical protein